MREPHAHRLLASNCFVVRGRDRVLLVDTGLGVAPLARAHPALREREDVVVVLTHAHYDHSGGAHEFGERLIHPAEAHLLTEPETATLRGADLGSDMWDELADQGLDRAEFLVDAVPSAGFDLDRYAIEPAPATGLVEDGDRIDLGDRSLRVLHLPGHTPGSIALLDESRGELFTGDVVYDGEPLLDALPESDRADYRRSMRRLLDLDVRVVHGGHGPTFDGARLRKLATGYLDRRAEPPGPGR